MKERIVSLETAELAKEKGFNYATDDAYFDIKEHDAGIKHTVVMSEEELSKSEPTFRCLAPTQNLLQKWLREQCGTHIEIKPVPMGNTYFKWVYTIGFMEVDPKCFPRHNAYVRLNNETETYYDTYEDALEGALADAATMAIINKK